MGHAWLLCVRLALSLLNSLFGWVRKVWVEALTWIAVKVVWGRVLLVVEVLCAAGMIEV